MIKEGTFKNGLREGKWIYYGDDETIAYVYHYTNGKKNGLYIRYLYTGERVEQCKYVNGVKEDKRVLWNKKGDKIKDGVTWRPVAV